MMTSEMMVKATPAIQPDKPRKRKLSSGGETQSVTPANGAVSGIQHDAPPTRFLAAREAAEWLTSNLCPGSSGHDIGLRLLKEIE